MLAINDASGRHLPDFACKQLHNHSNFIEIKGKQNKTQKNTWKILQMEAAIEQQKTPSSPRRSRPLPPEHHASSAAVGRPLAAAGSTAARPSNGRKQPRLHRLMCFPIRSVRKDSLRCPFSLEPRFLLLSLQGSSQPLPFPFSTQLRAHSQQVC